MSFFSGTSSKKTPLTELIKCRHLGELFIFEFLDAQLSYNTCHHVKWMDISNQIMLPLVSSKENQKAHFNAPVKYKHQPGRVDVKYLFCQAKVIKWQ